MSSKVLLLAVAQTVLFWGVGYVVADFFVGWTRSHERLGRAEHWLLACTGFSLWAAVLMVAHLVSGGRAFSQPWPVPVSTVLLLAVWLWSRRGRLRPATRPRTRALAVPILFAAALFVLYALPAIEGGSSLRTGDPPWHLGWTEQLLGGEPTPVGPAPRFTKNAYPWGLHAIAATQVRLVPGSDPLIALESLHLILIGAIPLAAACLARTVNPRAGWAAAVAASLVGGLGWVQARSPDFVVSPSEARYGADLVVASPNSVYELLPPALPRELGLVLLAGAAVLLVACLTDRDRRISIAAGLAVGAVGLVSVPMMLSAVAWLAALLIVHRADRPRALTILGAAVATFALWALPVAIDYLRFDGFVNVSPRLGVEWPLPTALGSWGILLPLAAAGVLILLTQPSVVRRDLLTISIAAVFLVVVALLRNALDWDVLANETLLHQGRFWPAVHLVGSALAGIALLALYGWRRRIGSLLAAILVSVGALSPAFASIDLTRSIREEKGGFLYGSRDLQEGSFVRRAAGYLDPDDVIRAEDDRMLLAFYLFQFSGARIAANEQTDPADNPWRIRFRELARRWRAYEQATDFDVDYVVTRSDGDPDSLERGEFRGVTWEIVPANL